MGDVSSLSLRRGVNAWRVLAAQFVEISNNSVSEYDSRDYGALVDGSGVDMLDAQWDPLAATASGFERPAA